MKKVKCCRSFALVDLCGAFAHNTLQMMQQKKGSILAVVFFAFILSCLYFLFHFHFMTQYVDYDQAVYVNNINVGLDLGYTVIYNPHHLLFEYSGELFHKFMVNTFGSSGYTDLMFNMRLRSLLASCIGLFFSVLYLKDMTGRLLWGILGGLLVGFCHGYLHYATKVDTGIFPVAYIPVMLWIVNRIGNVKKGIVPLSIAGGALVGFGVLLHQYLALACGLAFLALIVPRQLFGGKRPLRPFQIFTPARENQIDTKSGKRFVCALLFALTGVLVIVSAYFYAGKSFYRLSFDEPTPEKSIGIWSGMTFQQWLFAYQTTGRWGYGLKNFNPHFTLRGFTDSFLSQKEGRKYNTNPDFDYNLSKLLSKESFVENQLALFTLTVLAGTILFLPVLWRRYGRSMFYILACLVAFTVFFSYWEPFYFEFWLVPGALVCLLSILLLNVLGEKLSVLFKKIGALPFYGYAFFLVLIFASHNMLYYVIPLSRDRVTEGIAAIKPERHDTIFSKGIYKFPDDVYRNVYGDGEAAER